MFVNIIHTFAAGILLIAVFLDLISMILTSRRLVKKSGPSGVPVVSLVVYTLVLWWGGILCKTPWLHDSDKRLLLLYYALGFHSTVHFLIPLIIKILFNKQIESTEGKER